MYQMILRPYETWEGGVPGSLNNDADDRAQGDHTQPQRDQYGAIH